MAYVVEVVEEIRALSEDCISDDFYEGLHILSDDSVKIQSRKVVGIFNRRDNAEKCRRLQPEFNEFWQEGCHGPHVVIREIESDF